MSARTVMIEASDVGQFPTINDSYYTVDHATHFEMYFKNDIKEVLLIVNKLLLNTPTYNHMLEAVKRKNGQTAYNSLIIYYEGEEFIQRNIQLVFDTLNTTFYKGENTKVIFEKYVSIHLEADNLLFEGKYNNELGMDNATKIQHFQSGNTVDAGLEHAITTARKIGLYKETY